MTQPSDIVAPPPHIAVCVCTYNRPAGLKALLAALDRQRLGKLPDEQVEIVVIDNSAAGDAAAAWQKAGRKLRFAITSW